MLALQGYTFGSPALRNDSTIVYRGRRNCDGRAIVAKLLRNEYPTRSELARLRNEHALLRSVDQPEVVAALDLQKHGNGLVLIMEDVGDRSLRSLVGKRLPLDELLRLAIALAETVQAVHRHQIIHKDIKPHHFFLVDGPDSDGGRPHVKLIDFGIASRATREEKRALSPAQLEGTLAYMSPEQTGRMNRVVDRRSDLYGLGATLYELIAGAPPFPTSDPLELVHSHIARQPIDVRELRAEVPPVLSAIVMKLLAKVAEDRYQSAAGLMADLRECLDRLTRDGRIDEFALGQNDAVGELRIPQKLYGREAASASLLAAFERAQGGRAELLLISGYSGIGKSALVNQIQKALVKQGHFVAGKFDQLGRSVPYSAIAQACRELVRAILAEPPAAIEGWKGRLTEALGSNAQIVVNLVPELELLIGRQPPVQELGPAEARARFERTFQCFLRCVTRPDHPLALFLDDLQWADPGSLRLIHLALTAPDQGHLLLIGTYRDHEVGAVHPLTMALADLRGAGVAMSEIHVGPLSLAEVTQYVADALNAPAADVAPLAALTLGKTDGNPFFLGQFLTALHQDGLLAFDARARRWTWDAPRIEKAMATDNVVDFMVGKLRRLPPAVQQVLRLCACMGHRFDRRTVEIIADQPPAELAANLDHAVRSGLVLRLDGEAGGAGDSADASSGAFFRFLHDRVQQAAYALIDDRRKQDVHLRIGRLLFAAHKGNPVDEKLFSIVSHFNIGARLITDAGERRQLAHLNFEAGRRARDAAAYAAAVVLLGTAAALIGDGGWQNDYEVTHAAYLTRAECEFLRGNFDEAYRLLAVLERRARDVMDRVPGRALEITILTSQNRLAEAIDRTVDTCRLLGEEIPTDPAALAPAIDATFAAVQQALGGRAIESLIDLPLMKAPEKLAVINVLRKALPAAYQARPDIMVLMTLRATALMLEHGNHPVASYLYCSYGLTHLGITGDSDVAFRFAKLGIAVGDRIGNRAVEGSALFIYGAFLAHWRTSLADAVELLRRSLQVSLETGDNLHAIYSATISIFYRFYMGEPLDGLRAALRGYGELCARTGDVVNMKMQQVLTRVLAALQDQAQSPRSLDAPGFDEAELARSVAGNHSLEVHYLLLKALYLHFGGDYDGSIAAADRALPLPPGFFFVPERCFYRGLSVAAKLRDERLAEDVRARLLGELREAERSFAAWAAACPANHAHRHALLAAELASATGAADTAVDLYERAITLAQDRGGLQHQGLANELAAKFHLAQGRARTARVYMAEAHGAYERWGAKVKCQQLATQHPELVAGSGAARRSERVAPDNGNARALDHPSSLRSGGLSRSRGRG